MPTPTRGRRSSSCAARGRGSGTPRASEYLDFFAGLSVHNAGHCHPRIVAAIREQAGRLGGTSRTSSTPSRRCGSRERLAESSLGGRVFLCNSGAEANECAIKLVRKHAHARGIERPEIVVLEGAFHGRTLGALAATPRLAREDLLRPAAAGLRRRRRATTPRRCARRSGERTAAVMIEPIQGEAGDLPDRRRGAGRRPRGLRRARARCWSSTRSRRGMGRTGIAVGLRAAPGAPRRDHRGEGARRRPAGRRLRDDPASSATCSSRGDHGSTFAGGADRRRRGARGARGDRRPGAAAAASASSAPRCATGSATLDGDRRGPRPRPDGRRHASPRARRRRGRGPRARRAAW